MNGISFCTCSLLRAWAFRRAVVVASCLAVVSAVSRPACAVSLADLFNGGFVDAGSSRFSNWQLLNLDATGTVPVLTQITVNPLATDPANPGLQFVANGQLTIAGINSIDLVFRYRVDRLSGNTYTGHTVAMTGINFGGTGGITYVSDEMAGGANNQLTPAVAIADNEADVFQFTSTVGMLPQSRLSVTSNVFITGLAATDTINLSTFTQRFAQTGPAGVPGDYNQNGTIDAADYTLWRNKLAAPAGSLPNDTVGGVIGQGQFNLWKANFGAAGSASISGLPLMAVPEPASGLLMLVAAMSSWLRRRDKRGIPGRAFIPPAA